MIYIEIKPTEGQQAALDKAKEILAAEGLELVGTRPRDRE